MTFHEACRQGAVAVVRATLSEDRAWAGRSDERGMPALVAAAFGLQERRTPEEAARARDCVRLLLEAGADPNAAWTNEFGPLSALYGAAGMHYDPQMTEMLLRAGANPNDNESLYHSMESDDDHCTRLLLDAGARITGTNAVFHLLDYERPDRVRLLLERGADPNEESHGLGRPLHHAVRRNRSLEVIRLLLEAGATIDGHCFLMASRLGRADLVAEFGARGAGFVLSEAERFIAACAQGDETEAAQTLARHPDFIHTLTADQQRALPLAAQVGNAAGVRTMVKLGWPVAARGGDLDASALNFAVFRGDAEMARFLLAHGASWTEEHRYDDNVIGTLSFASRSRPSAGGDWVACARALVEAGMPKPAARYQFSAEVVAVFAGLA